VARVPYRSAEDLDAADRELMDPPINLFRALANSPGALRPLRGLGRWARWHSSIDPRLRELAILTVGLLTGSRYEYSHHVRLALSFGASERDIASINTLLSGEPTEFSELDRVVIDAARELTTDGTLQDRSWDYLEATLGREAAVDLLVIICHYNSVVRLLAALDIDIEPEYESIAVPDPPIPPANVAKQSDCGSNRASSERSA
jgi:alkylhydroperoxidase family enzyme